MSDKYILTDQREAVPTDSLEEWARAFEKTDRRVAHDIVGGHTISTVFLGIDHQFGKGPPLIFETMVFGPEDDEADVGRCSTWAEAEAMHAEMIRKYGGAVQ